jgi:hypothetical protein
MRIVGGGAPDLEAPTRQLEGMKKSGPRLPVIGNPVPHAGTIDPDQVDGLRRIDCRSYDRCLDLADEQGWPGFHCNECRGYEAPTPEERRHSYLGALRLLAETQLLASLADSDLSFVDEVGDEDDAALGQADAAFDDEAGELDDHYLDRVLTRRTGDTNN